MTTNLPEDKELLKQLKGLTLERLKVMPIDTELSIGSTQLSKLDLINAVKRGDKLGEEIMTIQLEFLQDLASGEIYKNDNSYNTASI